MGNKLDRDLSSFERGIGMIREIGNKPDVVERTNARFDLILRIAKLLATSPQRFEVDFDEGDRAKIYLQSTEEQDEPQLVIFTAYKGGDIEDISIDIAAPLESVRSPGQKATHQDREYYRINKETNLPEHLSDIRYLAISDRFAQTTVGVQDAHGLLNDIIGEDAMDQDTHLLDMSEDDAISRTQRGIMAFYRAWNT